MSVNVALRRASTPRRSSSLRHHLRRGFEMLTAPIQVMAGGRLGESLGEQRPDLADLVAAQQAIATSGSSVGDCVRAVCLHAQLLLGADGAEVELPDGDHPVHHGANGVTGGVVTVPLLNAGEAVGLLRVVSNRTEAFAPADMATLDLLATFAGSQLARALSLTRLALTNQALADSEARARRLAELSPDAVAIVDGDHRFVYANPAAASIFGFDAPDALLGVDMMAYNCEPETQHRRHQTVLSKTSVVRNSVEAVRNRRGEIVPIEISSAPYDLDGATAVLSVFRDISDRRQAEQALAASELRWRRAFEAAPMGVAEIDTRGCFLEVNAAFCDLIGYGRDWLLHASIDLLARPQEPLTPQLPSLGDTAPAVATLRVDRQLVHADGHTVWVQLSATAIQGHDGAGRVLCHAVDISDRKAIESQLQHLADHDSLTGLRNRRSFGLAITDQASRVARYGPQGALMVLDLDHFKEVNDRLGHGAGDDVLVAMADVLRHHLRDTDIIGRLGGDEFAVILPFLDRAGAEVVATKIVAAARVELAGKGADRGRQVTTSIGVAFFDDPNRCGEEVLIGADLMMYDAKQGGGNRFALHPTTAAPGRDRHATRSSRQPLS